VTLIHVARRVRSSQHETETSSHVLERQRRQVQQMNRPSPIGLEEEEDDDSAGEGFLARERQQEHAACLDDEAKLHVYVAQCACTDLSLPTCGSYVSSPLCITC
jgi:hypothetical protein